MADLTADGAMRWESSGVKTREWVLDNSAAQTLYCRQPLILDVSEDTLYGRGWKSTITLVDVTDVFLGIYVGKEKAVLTTDTETDNKALIAFRGMVGFPTSTLTNADAGKIITMSDSATVTTSAASASQLEIGRLCFVENGYAFVELNATRGGAPTIQDF